jgi:hypothetical protein
VPHLDEPKSSREVPQFVSWVPIGNSSRRTTFGLVMVVVFKFATLVQEITVNWIILLFNLAAIDLSVIFHLMFKVRLADDAYQKRTVQEANPI